MHPDKSDLTPTAINFHRMAEEYNCITVTDDFVIINRCDGKMCYFDWVTGDVLFFQKIELQRYE